MNVPSPGSRSASLTDVTGTARLMFYVLLAISLMAFDHRGRYVDRTRAWAEQAVEPVFWAIELPFEGAERLGDQLRERQWLNQRVAELEQELAGTRSRLGLLDDLRFENDRLRAKLEVTERTDQRLIAAEIGSADLNPFAHRILVRRGRAHGIRPGMPVLDDRAVIGQVDRVFQGMSRVVLISDPDHALPVQVLPGGERTIAYGSGSLDLLRLTDLPMNAAVRPGDLVVTSGIGGRFPAGLPVARIDRIERPAGRAFATAEATPLARMERNRVVLILETVDENVSTSGDAGDTGAEPAPDTPPPEAAPR